MAAIAQVVTIRRAAQLLGRDETLLWELSDQLEPEDRVLWVYDTDGAEVLAFTNDGIETLREIINDQPIASLELATKSAPPAVLTGCIRHR